MDTETEQVTREEKKKEAVERMKIIGIYPEVIKQFDNDDLVNESVPPYGACYWLSDEQKERVKQFEKDYNGLVYHVIHGKNVFPDGEVMEMECYLYVNDYPEEWELDRGDISDPEQLQALCYVNNLTAPEFSELGAVGFKVSPAGGLLRTW